MPTSLTQRIPLSPPGGAFARVRVAVAALLFAIGVTGITPSVAQDPTAVATRVVTDDLGNEITIPVEPLRIVVTDLEHLGPMIIELGAPLAGMPGRVNPAWNGGQPYAPGMQDMQDFRFETSGVTFIGLQGQIDIEALAAVHPDLIIARSTSEADRRDQFMQIAPTYMTNIFWTHDGDGIEQYRQLAELIGREDRFNELNALWQDRVQRYRTLLEERVGDPSRIVVAEIEARAAGIFINNNNFAINEVFCDLGFSLPPIAAGGDTLPAGGRPGRVDMSAEQMPLLETDFLFTRTYVSMTPTGMPSITDILGLFEQAAPGWTNFVHAGRNGQHIIIEEGQSESNTFAARKYVLDQVMAAMVYRPFVPVAAEAPRVPMCGTGA